MAETGGINGLVSELAREDLNDLSFPSPPLERWFRGIHWTAIRRLSRSGPESAWPAELQRITEDLVTGLYGQFRPWMFLLHWHGAKLCCAFGSSGLSPEPLPWMLQSVFPDAVLDSGIGIGELCLPRAVALTGVPTVRAGPQIDRLCRALRGSDLEWAYLLRAEPVGHAEIRMALDQVQDQMFDVNLRYATQNQPAMRFQADRANSLLVPKLKRFQTGRAIGMWKCRAFLLSGEAWVGDLGGVLLRSAFSGKASVPVPIRTHACSLETATEPPLELLDSSLCAALARLPLEDYPGYEILKQIRFGLQAPIVEDKQRIRIASILDHNVETGEFLEIGIRDLTKHALVVGVTGSGKTTTCVRILNEATVPFLVIEPAKSEYREKLQGLGVTVFTAGNENDSPLRLNPFDVPKHTLVQTHIDYLKALFMGVFVLYPPMPQVLEISLQQIYEDRGWNLAANNNPRGKDHPRRFPALSDLISKVKEVTESLTYASDTKSDIGAALATRLEGLRSGGGKGPMYDVRTSVPDEVLFERSCIIEMKEIANDDEKAFLIGLLLMRLYEYREGNRGQPGGLKHITLVEEAHRLLRNVPGGPSENFANPKGQAAETFSNMLAELRAYGEGIIIAEQLPSKLAPDVIKNTNLKIVHRMVAKEDRTVLGATMNLSDEETSYMTRLMPGRALAFAEGLQRPVIVRISPREPLESEPLKTVPYRFTGMPTTPSWVDRLLDLPLEIAYWKLFSSMWRTEPDADLFVDNLEEFTTACYRTGIQGKDSQAWWHALTERGLERRGEFHHWRFEEVDDAIHRANEVFKSTSDALSAFYRRESDSSDQEWQQLMESIAADLRPFAEFWNMLSDLGDANRPFPGCDACVEACHYRFDMQSPVQVELNGDDEYQDRRGKILEYADGEASERFAKNDVESRQRAALCWAVQQLGKGAVTVLPADTQREWAAQLNQDFFKALNPDAGQKHV
jgi:hypothetical protein